MTLAPQRTAALALGDAHFVAWTTPWGAALAHVARTAPEAEQRAHVAARGDAASLPALLRIDDGAAALACAGGAATLTTWTPETTLRTTVAEHARAVACAAGRRASQLFVCDARGLVGLSVRADGRTLGETSRWLARSSRRALLAAARVHEHGLAIACFDDEPAAYVAHDGRGAPEHVRHTLSAPMCALAATGAGSRGGVALVEQGGRRVHAFTLGLDGRMVDRTHVLLDDPSARFDEVSVLWWQDGFVAVVRDARTERARVVRFADRAELGAVERAPEGAAWLERAGDLCLVAARASEVGAELEIRGGPLGGATTRRARVGLASPPEILADRADAAATALLDELRAMVSGGGYRGGPSETGAGSTLSLPELALALDVETHEGGFVLDVRAAAEAPRAAIVRWWSGEQAALARWASERCATLSAQRARASHDAHGVHVRVWISTLPAPAALMTWLRALAADVAAHAWSAASG